MIDFEKEVNEIKELLEKNNEQTKTFLDSIEGVQKDSVGNSKDSEDVPKDSDGSEELLSVSLDSDEGVSLETLSEQLDSISEYLEDIQKTQVESGWVLAIAIVLSVGLAIFWNQFLKW